MKSLEVLNTEWKAFCDATYREWVKTQPAIPCYAWNPYWEFEAYEARTERFAKYFHQIGIDWWKERGYTLIWPKNIHGEVLVEKNT